MNIAIVPGSFDPVTNGHLDIIRRTSGLFDTVYVSILSNSSKTPLFTIEERINLIERVTKDIPNVKVESFTGLLVDYAREKNAKFIVKGLRAGSDFENEFQMALINHKINPALDTMFLTAEHQYMYLSSSIVKELAGYDVDLSEFLPEQIIPIFKQRIADVRQGGNRK